MGIDEPIGHVDDGAVGAHDARRNVRPSMTEGAESMLRASRPVRASMSRCAASVIADSLEVASPGDSLLHRSICASLTSCSCAGWDALQRSVSLYVSKR